MIRALLCGLIGITILTSHPSSGFAQFRELTKRIPDGANAIFFVDVNKLQNSPLGKDHNWREKQEEAFEAGIEAIPPQANTFVAAAKLDLETKHPEWQVGLMDLKYDPSLPKVAVRYQGTTDFISERSVAILPGDIYVVKFMENIVGYGTPATRQDVALWITRYYDNSLRGLSEYLAEAQTFADAGSPIIVALDLTHVVSPQIARNRLDSLETLKGRKVDLDQLAKVLASVRGISLGVTVQQSMTGAVKVDFSEDVSILKDFAKPLLLEILGKQGMMIDEIDSWEVTVSNNRVQLTGPLYASGLRRIFSLVDAPPSLQEARQKATKTGDNSEADEQKDLTIAASQIYYKSVVSLLDELRTQKKGRQTMGQISVWFDKYARKIDRLPIANVDADLLSYGRYVSESLRTGQSEVIDAAARSRIRQNEVPEQYDVTTYSAPIGANWAGQYSWNGWEATPDWQRTGSMMSNVRMEEQIKGAKSANDVMRDIDNATADIRRHMTQKYGVEF
ncbi:hypothetical protein C5Y96_10110 [Blastopirellula marina]|uniref:Uncharacterized protein n=1 Tax=Blastopirellula marina TaxID=124 RepID=A0A2S8FMF2_9BACT|nr:MULTISPECIES: hypothetical protein [Pirellulaceae]PQO33200.1 hypothetical protein C5Y96_10110 [Blastopirellula marina]RCS52289.1 hypothetical protein DTL36_10120 [Bremerella cremea]